MERGEVGERGREVGNGYPLSIPSFQVSREHRPPPMGASIMFPSMRYVDVRGAFGKFLALHHNSTMR